MKLEMCRGVLRWVGAWWVKKEAWNGAWWVWDGAEERKVVRNRAGDEIWRGSGLWLRCGAGWEGALSVKIGKLDELYDGSVGGASSECAK